MSETTRQALLAALDAHIRSEVAGAVPPVVPAPPPVPSSSPLQTLYLARMRAALTSLEQPAGTGDRVTFASAAPPDRAYYDVPLACWRLGKLVGGDPGAFAIAAVREGAAYRATLVTSGEYLVPSVQPGWKPGILLDPGTLRRIYAAGQLAEYQASGSADAKRAVLGLANTVLAGLPQLLSGTPVILERTERNMAYALYALAAGAQLDTKFVGQRDNLIARAVAWNARSASGGFDHSLAAHDAAECEQGFGGSPFMSALLVDALVMAAPRDPRIATVAGRVSDWLAANITHDSNQAPGVRGSYKYLAGCQSDKSWDVGWWEDLNAMIVSVHGHAFRLTGQVRHKAVGEEMLTVGLKAFRGDRSPKHFAQDAYGAKLFA